MVSEEIESTSQNVNHPLEVERVRKSQEPRWRGGLGCTRVRGNITGKWREKKLTRGTRKNFSQGKRGLPWVRAATSGKDKGGSVTGKPRPGEIKAILREERKTLKS